MPDKIKFKSMLERKRASAEYKKLHDETYAVFKLETQILLAMEDKGWSQSDLAHATHTSKSNVSRDLRAGGLLNASLSRIGRIADVLGMRLIALLVPKNVVGSILPRIERLIADVTNSATTPIVESPRFAMAVEGTSPWNSAVENVPNYRPVKVRQHVVSAEFVYGYR